MDFCTCMVACCPVRGLLLSLMGKTLPLMWDSTPAMQSTVLWHERTNVSALALRALWPVALRPDLEHTNGVCWSTL